MSEEVIATTETIAPPARRFEIPEAPKVEPAASETVAQDTADPAPALDKPVEEKKAEEPKPAEEEKPGQARFDRRLARAYRERAEAQAQAEVLRQQLEALKPKASPEVPGEPRLEDFSDIKEYANAVAAHREQYARAQWEKGQQQQAAQAAQARLLSDWEAKTSKVESKYVDFDEVVGDLRPTTPWAIAIMQAENGADIAYYLGQNGAAEGRRIAALDPLSQVREIGKLEAKFAAAPPTPKAPSKAPVPIKPVTGTSASRDDEPNESMSMKDWIKARNRELGRR